MFRVCTVVLATLVLTGAVCASPLVRYDATQYSDTTLLAESNARSPDQIRPSFPAQDSDQISADLSGQPNSWLYAIAVLLSIGLIVSVLVSFYLYRWRRILLSSPHLLVPEELGERIHSHEKALRLIEKAFVTKTMRLEERSGLMSGQITSLIDTFMALQNAIDEKDQEIKRFKNGYDIQVFRRYLYRFVRVHQSIVDFERDGELGEREISFIKRLLEDALDECGVEPFEPEIGGDFREIDGVADRPQTILTETAEENFKVAEVTESGYRIRTEGEHFDTIIPAKVKIFVHNGKD
jgi:hypothetical protein